MKLNPELHRQLKEAVQQNLLLTPDKKTGQSTQIPHRKHIKIR